MNKPITPNLKPRRRARRSRREEIKKETPKPTPNKRVLNLTLLESDRIQIIFEGIKIRLTQVERIHFENQKGVELIVVLSKFGTPQLKGIRCPIESWLREIEHFSLNPSVDKQIFLNEVSQMKRKRGDEADRIVREMNERAEKEDNPLHPLIRRNKQYDNRTL